LPMSFLSTFGLICLVDVIRWWLATSAPPLMPKLAQPPLVGG
jgi:hypothetical protein